MVRVIPAVFVAALLAAALLAPAAASAQRFPPPEGRIEWSTVRYVGDVRASLSTTWLPRDSNGSRRSVVTLRTTVSTGRASRAVPVYAGPAALTSLALRDGSAVVTLVNGSSRPFVRLTLVALDGSLRTTAVRVPLSAGGTHRPAYAFACPDPDGFTVLLQEQSLRQANDPRTTFMRVAADGRWLEAPHVVSVPWGFAAIAAHQGGYALALYYDGATAAQTTLSLVTLDAHGRPTVHPWWASRPEWIGEVQLASSPSGLAIAFRGGADGRTLRTTTSTGAGQWGVVQNEPRGAGGIEPGHWFAARTRDGAEVEWTTGRDERAP